MPHFLNPVGVVWVLRVKSWLLHWDRFTVHGCLCAQTCYNTVLSSGPLQSRDERGVEPPPERSEALPAAPQQRAEVANDAHSRQTFSDDETFVPGREDSGAD